MTLDWSKRHSHFDKALLEPSIIEQIQQDLVELLGGDIDDIDVLQPHKWLYAHPLNPLKEGFVVTGDRRLWATGDWAAGTGIDDSFVAVEKMMHHLQVDS